MPEPQVRKLERGGHVVDMGNHWFVVEQSGRVIAKETRHRTGVEFGHIAARTPTKKEKQFALIKVAEFIRDAP